MTVTATSTAWAKDGPVKYGPGVVVQTCEYTCGALSPTFRVYLFKIPDRATILDFRMHASITATSTATNSFCGAPYSVGIWDAAGTAIDTSAILGVIDSAGVKSLNVGPYYVSVSDSTESRWVTLGIDGSQLSASRSIVLAAQTIKAWVMYDCKRAEEMP
jgi:hypothetical protein